MNSIIYAASICILAQAGLFVIGILLVIGTRVLESYKRKSFFGKHPGLEEKIEEALKLYK